MCCFVSTRCLSLLCLPLHCNISIRSALYPNSYTLHTRLQAQHAFSNSSYRCSRTPNLFPAQDSLRDISSEIPAAHCLRYACRSYIRTQCLYLTSGSRNPRLSIHWHTSLRCLNPLSHPKRLCSLLMPLPNCSAAASLQESVSMYLHR
ncbi:MAG: hypothetical protein BWY95_00975 [Bacteroidetes bacterium ADurb.BinA104]|nr:MAG: hypothetical protein BWY95_00975 [Bacteroidetes bacterium ADurb.BinA104]